MNSAKTRRFDVIQGRSDHRCAGWLGASRHGSGDLAHLRGMNDSVPARAGLEPVVTTSELAAHLGVPVQTIHDLRHGGRGPCGFRVGREIRFRISEIEAWMAVLEQADRLAHDMSSDVADSDEGDVR